MTFPRLTAFVPPARTLQNARPSGREALVKAVPVLVAMTAAAMLAGCISVNAPDKPIVIELNINIKQEVIYRLAEDVKQNIDANPDIF
jgi:YnbE-like lipoprotein